MLITRVPGGPTSTWIHDRLAGRRSPVALGSLRLVHADPSVAALLLLAAGSGLAPIRALLEAELATASRRSLTVLFSARTEADVIDREGFAALVAAHSRLRFIRTLTRGPGPAPRGRIPGLLPELSGGLAGDRVFIAGSSGFVLGCAAAAVAAGARVPTCAHRGFLRRAARPQRTCRARAPCHAFACRATPAGRSVAIQVSCRQLASIGLEASDAVVMRRWVRHNPALQLRHSATAGAVSAVFSAAVAEHDPHSYFRCAAADILRRQSVSAARRAGLTCRETSRRHRDMRRASIGTGPPSSHQRSTAKLSYNSEAVAATLRSMQSMSSS